MSYYIIILLYLTMFSKSFSLLNHNIIKNNKVIYKLSNGSLNICQNDECNQQYKKMKLISLSPGGLKGFYLMGITTFIKENYCLDDYVFSGASAGAWNALYMTYKGDPKEFMLRVLDERANSAKTVIDVKNTIKNNILKNYKNEDFELEKLFIGVKTFSGTVIYSNFESVEDALDCCIASSHIPLITGGLLNLYHNKYTFDGGFAEHPYLQIPSLLHITPTIWEKNELDDFGRRSDKNDDKPKEKTCIQKINDKKLCLDITQYTTLFSRDKYDFLKTYERGYNDTKKNRRKLDYIFMNDKYDEW